jgi:glutaredoxin
MLDFIPPPYKYGVMLLLLVCFGVAMYFAVKKIKKMVGKKKSGFERDGRDGTMGGGDKGNIIVYGSKTCPWCVKQEKYFKDKGIDYTFVNCPTDTCPEFVSGFPTLMVNGQIKNGYTEL